MRTTSKLSYLSRFSALVLAIVYASMSTLSGQANQNQKDVRIIRNQDGTHSELSRGNDKRTLYRRTYAERKNGAGDRVLHMAMIYRKDIQGRLRSGEVRDGEGNLLYRVKYGYHKDTGQLVQEDMFDARVKRTKVVTGPDGKPMEKEEAVRQLFHRYDAQGRAARPICICLPAGKMAEELFGKGNSTHIEDPWQN